MLGLFRKKKKEKPFVTAVVAAGGSSSRMGGENKLLCEIGEAPVLVHTLRAFQQCEIIDEIVMAAREDMVVEYSNLAAAWGITKLTKVVAGGVNRAESVYKAACQASDSCAYLAVHDGARPLITPEEITAVCQKAFDVVCAAAMVPVKDTIKRVCDGFVAETVDRSTLYAAQTPQVADKALLLAALQQAIQQQIPITDECMALELLGKRPAVVVCSYENIKITTPEDLLYAEMVLVKRRNG